MREKRLLARLPLPARLKSSSIQTCGRNLKRALIGLIDNHDKALAAHFADGKLALESYKEYIETFARSLKETMESREGVSYLLRAVGFDVKPEEVNLQPELRWKSTAAVFDAGSRQTAARRTGIFAAHRRRTAKVLGLVEAA